MDQIFDHQMSLSKRMLVFKQLLMFFKACCSIEHLNIDCNFDRQMSLSKMKL